MQCIDVGGDEFGSPADLFRVLRIPEFLRLHRDLPGKAVAERAGLPQEVPAAFAAVLLLFLLRIIGFQCF